MSARATRLLGIAGLIGAVAAIAWYGHRPVDTAPEAAAAAGEALPVPRWRPGTCQQYRVDVDSVVRVGSGVSASDEPIRQQVRGVLTLRTLAVADERITVGMQFGTIDLLVGGIGDADIARALGAPFRVAFDRAGMPLQFEFAADVEPRHRAFLTEVLRTFQVVVRGADVWRGDEEHATGRYEASYERTAPAQVRRTKLRYHAPSADGPPPVAVRQATAAVQLDVRADWIAGMVVDETLVARDASGATFEVTTRATLALLPAAVTAAVAPANWSFEAAKPEVGTPARAGPGSGLTEKELAIDLAALLASLDAATEGRTVWVHRLRDLLRADDRVAALLLARMQAEAFTDRTRSDLFLAIELAATPSAQHGLVQVAQGAAWVHRDRARALVALGGLERPAVATVDALWATTRTRADAAQCDLANTAMLALGAIGRHLAGADEAAYANLRDGILVEAWGARGAGERAIAVLALANTGDRALGQQLTPFLDDAEADVRRAAAKAVGRLGGEAAVAELALRLPHEPNSAVRAAMAAGCAASPQAAPEVQAMARDQIGVETDDAARMELARCLGRHLAAHPDNEKALRAMFAVESSPAIRRYAGEVLGRADAARRGGPVR